MPALSVGQAIREQKPKIRLLFIGSTKKADRTLVDAAGFDFVAIPAGKLRRYFDFQNFIDIFKTIAGFFVASWYIVRFWPDRVFVKGGFVGVPVGIAAWLFRRPLIIHESDVKVGLANRILMPLASWVCLSFPLDGYNLSPAVYKKSIHTGLPINSIFYEKEIENNIGIPLSPSYPLILVIGGSQGASAINTVIRASLPSLVQNYQIFHISGKGDFDELKDWAEVERFRNYFLFSGLSNDQIAFLMRKAAIVISRAGATAISEIAASAKPAILVPLPGSASNHQEANADYLEEKQAAIVVDQENLNTEIMQEIFAKVLGSDLGHRLIFNIKSLSSPESAVNIASLVIDNKIFDPDEEF